MIVSLDQVPRRAKRVRVLAAARHGRDAPASYAYSDAFSTVGILRALRNSFVQEKGVANSLAQALSQAWNSRHEGTP